MGRLRPGETVDTAAAALRQAQPSIRDATMPNYRRAEDRENYLREPLTALSAPAGDSPLGRYYGRPLFAILAIVGLVLVIGCFNVAVLLLARAESRRYELSVRVALGASRLRVARQLFAESLLLSGFGGALGFLFATWASRLLLRLVSQHTALIPESAFTVSLDLSLNWRVLGFTATIALFTAILFGTAPAWRAARVDPGESLKEQGRTLIRGSRLGTDNLLVVAQVTLSLILVVAPILFIRSFTALANLPLGFERDRVLLVRVDTRHSASESAGPIARYERVLEAAASAPGVASAGLSIAMPITGLALTAVIELPDGPSLSERDRTVYKNLVSPNWFRTLGTRFIAGRDFDAHDRAGGPGVAIVNEAFTRRFMKGESPLGRTVREVLGAKVPPLEIVGLVADAVYRMVREPVPPTIYLPVSPDLLT